MANLTFGVFVIILGVVPRTTTKQINQWRNKQCIQLKTRTAPPITLCVSITTTTTAETSSCLPVTATKQKTTSRREQAPLSIL